MEIQINLNYAPGVADQSGPVAPQRPDDPSCDPSRKVPKHNAAVALLLLAEVEAGHLQLLKDEEVSKEKRDQMMAQQVISDAVSSCKDIDQALAFLDQLKKIIPPGNQDLINFIEKKEEFCTAAKNDPTLKDLYKQLDWVNTEIKNKKSMSWFIKHPKAWLDMIKNDFSSHPMSVDDRAKGLTAAIETDKETKMAQMQEKSGSVDKQLLQINENDKNIQGTFDTITSLSKSFDPFGE